MGRLTRWLLLLGFSLFPLLSPLSLFSVPLEDLDKSGQVSQGGDQAGDALADQPGGAKASQSVTAAGLAKKLGKVEADPYLNFRSGPWGAIIGRLHTGDQVEILGKEGDWYRVRFNGQEGYAHSNYIHPVAAPPVTGPETSVESPPAATENPPPAENPEPVPAPATEKGTVRVSGSLNFRAGPWGQIIGSLSNGQQVEILAREGDWYKVRVDGQEGYAFAQYVNKGGGEPTPDPTPSPSSPSGQAVSSTAGGGVECTNVPLLGQVQPDPYDPDGGMGQHPYAYCGPTSLQMILASKGVHKSRDYLALTDVGEGPMWRGCAYYGPMVAMARSLGFPNTCQRWAVSLDDLKEMLAAGRPQIVSIEGYVRDVRGGGYQVGGHVVTITGMDGDGNIIMQDPYDPSLKPQRRVLSPRDFLAIWNWRMTVDVH